jgi:hypothetical protein
MLEYLFDNEIWQRSDIERLKSRVARNERMLSHRKNILSKRGDERWQEASDELAHLTLYCKTAVSLMIEKGLITPDEFVKRMRELDATDGQMDGKMSDGKTR